MKTERTKTYWRLYIGRVMLQINFVLLTLLLATSASAQNDVVATAKQELLARGVSIDGACGAIKITNLVAWRLRPFYGLLHKAGGNRAILKADGSCLTGEQSSDPEGYATDYLIRGRDGVGFDLLGDGGGANIPQWAGPEDSPDMVSRNFANYREPVDPAAYLGGVPTPPVVVPPTPPVVTPPAPPVVVLPSTDLSPVLNQQAIDHAILLELQQEVAAARKDVAEFREAVRSKWSAVVNNPVFKYGLAAVIGVLTTHKWGS